MSSLTLSSADCVRFSDAISLLLQPQHSQSLLGWQLGINHAMKELLGADLVSFQIAAPGHPGMVSREADFSSVRDYPTYFAAWNARYSVAERM